MGWEWSLTKSGWGSHFRIIFFYLSRVLKLSESNCTASGYFWNIHIQQKTSVTDYRRASSLQALMVNLSFLTLPVASSCPQAQHPAQRETWCLAGLVQLPHLHHRVHHHHLPPHHCGVVLSGQRVRERGALSRVEGSESPQSVEINNTVITVI